MALNTLFTDEPQQAQEQARLTAEAALPGRSDRILAAIYAARAGLSRTQSVAKRSMFWTLLGLSVLFGAMCGLVIVFSIDLPQMEDLAKYRPNTTTELLDVHGKEIGSFALERRVVIPYTDIPDQPQRCHYLDRRQELRAQLGRERFSRGGGRLCRYSSAYQGARVIHADDATGA